MKTIKILVADDHPVVREGIVARLLKENGYRIVGEVNNGEVIKSASQLRPDIIIMDIVMPLIDGILAIELIKKSIPKVKIIILSMHKRREYALRAFQAGADGYILKENASKIIINAIKSVLQGTRYICPLISQHLADTFIQSSLSDSFNPFDSLSLREKEVLRLLIDGKKASEIAKTLFITVATVKTHRNNIMKKLSVNDIASLIRVSIQNGFLTSLD